MWDFLHESYLILIQKKIPNNYLPKTKDNMSIVILNSLEILYHLFLPEILCGRHLISHFGDEQTDAQRLGHLLLGTWLIHGKVRIWTQAIWTSEPMFFTCRALLHLILIIFYTMNSAVPNLENWRSQSRIFVPWEESSSVIHNPLKCIWQ